MKHDPSPWANIPLILRYVAQRVCPPSMPFVGLIVRPWQASKWLGQPSISLKALLCKFSFGSLNKWTFIAHNKTTEACRCRVVVALDGVLYHKGICMMWCAYDLLFFCCSVVFCALYNVWETGCLGGAHFKSNPWGTRLSFAAAYPWGESHWGNALIIHLPFNSSIKVASLSQQSVLPGQKLLENFYPTSSNKSQV